jgi:hypothetical protein
MKNEVYTIEDCLELLTGLKGQAKFQIESSDQTFLNSIGRQTFKGIALTDKQHTVIKEKLLGYRDQFTVLDYDIDLYLDTLRMPLREIDRSKYITLVHNVNESLKGYYIKVRFPFSKKLIIAVEEITAIVGHTNHYHNKGSHEHFFRMSERAIFEIVNRFQNKQFNIDKDILDLYEKIETMNNNKNNYVPGVYNYKLKNLNERATNFIISSIGEPSEETLALYKDRQQLFGLHHFDQQELNNSLSHYSTLSKGIINRAKPQVLVKSTQYTLNNIAESLLDLDRFPLLVLISDTNPLDDLYRMHQSLKGFIDDTDSSVLFRLDNAVNFEFNDYIKKNNLNSKLDKNTKVVYINYNITKPLINSGWKPSAVLLLSSHRFNSKVKVFVEESDLVIHYDTDVSPFLQHNVETI